MNVTDPNAATAARNLHLGCGAHILDGWLNADLVETNSAPPGIREVLDRIFVMDATKPFPFADEQLDFVFCEDFIEHFPQKDGLCILAECRRTLRPGGTLRISTPSFDNILARLDLSRRDRINLGHWGWGHHLLYTEACLRKILTRCGFDPIVSCAFRQSARPELQNLECRADQADLNIIVEGTKAPSTQTHGAIAPSV